MLLVAEKLNEKIITYDNKFNSIENRLASLEKQSYPKNSPQTIENVEIKNNKFPEMNKEFENSLRDNYNSICELK